MPPTSVGWMVCLGVALGGLAGCGHGKLEGVAPACGEGTHAEEGECVADDQPDTADTADTADTGGESGLESGSDTAPDTGVLDADGDGYSTTDGDCDDTNAAVHPGATEVCGDGVDDDCDGTANGCPAVGAVELTTAAGEIQGTDAFGVALAAGDFDGDGTDDLAVSAPWSDSTGVAWVYSAPHAGTSTEADATAWFAGGEDTNTGSALAAADIDGDGAAELIIGDPGREHVGGYGMIFRGPLAGELRLADAFGSWTAESDLDLFGARVATGDLDGDGWTDVAFGAPGASDSGGRTYGAVYIFGGAGLASSGGSSGPASAADTRWYGANIRNIALAMGIAPDLDGDGLDELVVGGIAKGTTESVLFVLPEPTGGVAYADLSAVATVHDEGALSPGDGWTCVAGVGDLDGDGYGELALGNPHAGSGLDLAGEVYLLSGPFVGDVGSGGARAHLSGGAEVEQLGSPMTPRTDVDGDGVVDLLIGAPGDSTEGAHAGAVFVVPGDVEGAQTVQEAASLAFVGIDARDECAASAVGDFDADALIDLAVGCSGRQHREDGAGSVYLYFGGVF